MVFGLRPATGFEKRLGYRFKNPNLLETALTHRSYAHEKGSGENYERLEYLGDAVLGLVAAEWLFARHPDLPEGELSRLKSYLVSAHTLGRHAQSLGLGEALRVGAGEERTGGRGKSSLLADSMEAVLGAVYLDGGLKAARSVIQTILEDALVSREASGWADAKTALQERAQARGWPLPEYRLVDQTGPDHQKIFTVECWLRGERAGSASGESKKIAEQRAAAEALRVLGNTLT